MLGFPLWNELALDLIDFVWERKLDLNKTKVTYDIVSHLRTFVSNGKLISAITYCRDILRECGKEKEYQDKIKAILYDKDKYNKASANEVYLQLQKLLKKAVVLQTNLDKSIEEFCNLSAHIHTNLPKAISAPCLIYLHGIVTDPSSWIITRDEYDKFYQRSNTLAMFIQSVFKNYDVVFLGYSFSDKEVLDEIAKVAGCGRKYVMVIGEMPLTKGANIVLENEYKYYGIDVVRYNIEQNGYDDFQRFLRDINAALVPPVKIAVQGQDRSRLNE